MKKWIKRVFLAGLGLVVALQLVPVNRAQPVIDPAKKLQPPPDVEAVLRASCYDCHSNETKWPWYGYVAPVSWWIANHVNDGRRHLNLSEWADLKPRPGRETRLIGGQLPTTAQYQVRILGDMETSIMEEQMPIPSYLIMHPEARMSPEQFKLVTDWFHQLSAQISAGTVTKSK